jgi:hypothetical protein
MHVIAQSKSSAQAAPSTQLPPLAADAMGCIPLLAEATTAELDCAVDEAVLEAVLEAVEPLVAEVLPPMPPDAPDPLPPPAPPLPLPLPDASALSPSSESEPVAQLAATTPVAHAVMRTSTSSM